VPRNIITGTPTEFFRDAFADALHREHVTATPFAEYYVVQLLVAQIEHAVHPDETLSDRFALAHRALPHQRRSMLRDVGDRALVCSGLWWERDSRPLRPQHAGLYLTLGRTAYHRVGGEPFDELAEKFSAFADALIRLGTAHSLSTARDIIRLYALWQETGSRHAMRALGELGLVPVRASNAAPS